MESRTRSSSAHRRDEAGEQRPEVSRPGVRVLSSTASTLRRRREFGSISIVSGNRRKAADTWSRGGHNDKGGDSGAEPWVDI